MIITFIFPNKISCERILLMIFILFFAISAKGYCQCEVVDFCENEENRLLRDLSIVEFWNRKLCDRLPVTYNHLLYGGYFNMPSARMGKEGEIAFGYAHVHPYRIWSARCQLTNRLELTLNYRIFTGVDDPILTPLGFGDMSDKGANFKYALFHPEDSDYKLPGIAFGYEDFLGTRNFKARYIVATQVFMQYDLEISLGYGAQRLRGIFGGITWLPMRQWGYSYLSNLALCAEYDATPYKDEDVEKHPKGRKTKTPINFGIKYRLWDVFDFSLSYVRGIKLAAMGSVCYNFGSTKGFVPKINDCLPYTAPVCIEPLGWRRPEAVLTQELCYAFKQQGFDLLTCYLLYDCIGQKTLRLNVYNDKYRTESDVRERFNYLLAYLIPEDIQHVVVVLEAEGFPVQEYHYQTDHLRKWGAHKMCSYELGVLSPEDEVTFPDLSDAALLYKRDRRLFCWVLLPKTHTFFGSSKGKFKYTLGVNFGVDGYLYNDIFYTIRLGYNFLSDIWDLKSVDRLNPSQIINVRTDVIRYYQQRGITLDKAYLQKNWNLGSGLYARLAGGYFEEEYGGTAVEFLYYPLRSNLAIGVEAACMLKRTIRGLGFTNKIRKYDCFTLTHRHFIGSQYFANIYYDCPPLNLDLEVNIGKFLANDWGVRYQVSRYFPSGLRVSFWYTRTNAYDTINGERYHDKGVGFSMPLDIFYTCSCREKWSYSLSAWLRDVGVTAESGYHLYEMIRDQRLSR